MSAAIALLAAGAMFTAASANADPVPTGLDTSGCTNPLLSQPFLSWNDSRYYTLVPGESPDSFNGTGWTLTGGARIVSTTLADGTTGNVLDLPRAASATSPLMCVSNAYPKARTMVRGSDEISLAVSYQGTESWLKPKDAGHAHSDHGTWAPSDDFDMHPADGDGWQLVRFVLTGKHDAKSDTQLYNFYIDPYAKR
jgi:hypothetical protein